MRVASNLSCPPPPRRAGEYECIYGNKPLFGLAKASTQLAITGAHQTAKGRLGAGDGTDAPEDVEVRA